MAKIGVSLKIDVSKIEKSRLFKGAKGTYLDATVFIDTAELDQFGNSGMITQDVKKEEKQSGVKGAILGNCKVFWSDSEQLPQQAPQPQTQGYQQQRPAPQQPQQQPQQHYQQNQQLPAGDEWQDSIPF